MGYEESLRHARDLLVAEISTLREQLAKKEASLKRLDSFFKEPYAKNSSGKSLTEEIVQLVYDISQKHNRPVSAKEVVKEFLRKRGEVNESTIRSTLYQVTRKQSPTEVLHGEKTVEVRVIKRGPAYSVQMITPVKENEGGYAHQRQNTN